jgi:hypothetical protein
LGHVVEVNVSDRSDSVWILAFSESRFVRAGTNTSTFTGIAAAAALVAASVAGCNPHPPQSSSPMAPGEAAHIKATLSYQPRGSAALTWDRQSENVTAKLQIAGFTPGGTYAIGIHHGDCATMGDVAVPFPEVTADGGGAINTTITSGGPAPGGLLPATALAVQLDAGGQLGDAPLACGDITAAVVTATLAMAPVGQRPQGSADVTYDSGNKTLIVATSASGLAPGSGHAQRIGLGTCEAQGATTYPLNDLVASANGTAYQTTVVQNVDQAPPPSGWYLSVHFGSSAQVQQDGQPTPYVAPIMCGNIGR